MKIAHLAIWTRDIEKMKDFYEKYFEAASNEKYVNEKKGFESYFLTFDGATSLELMRRKDIDVESEAEALGYAHMAFGLKTRRDVDRLTGTLEADGWIHKDGPRLTGDGYYEAVFLDPEGNTIELVAEET
jgi:lactoylglutathione lyase